MDTSFYAMLANFIQTIIIIAIAIYVIAVIANWKIFEKAGEPGWKSLIPIYNFYIMFKVVGMKNWFWIVFCFSLISNILSNVSQPSLLAASSTNSSLNSFAHIVSIISDFVSLVAFVTYSWRLSKVFGHGNGFFIGLLLFPNLFWLILAFGKSTYDIRRLQK